MPAGAGATSTRDRRDGDLVRRARAAAAASIAMLLGAAVLTAIVASDVAAPPFLQDLDDAWRRVVLAWPDPTRRAGDLLETVGAGVVMVPVRLVVAVWLALRRRRWDLAAWVAGWVLADVLTFVLKPGLARERPTATDSGNPFTSFPSAHAKTAAQVAIGLVLVLTSPWRSRAVPYVLACLWIALMSLSRTVVDHHWLSDVVAGSLIGAGATVLCGAALRAVRDARRSTNARDNGASAAPR